MAQSNPRSFIENARAGGYAVGAFNMHNEETTEALVWANAASTRATSVTGWASSIPFLLKGHKSAGSRKFFGAQSLRRRDHC